MKLKYAFAIATFALGLTACESDAPAGDVEVVAQHVVVTDLGAPMALHIDREFAGLVMPRQNVDIAFEIAGKITAVHVDEGERVEQGDILAALDREVLRAQRDELIAQVADNAAQRDLNLANRKRFEDLRDGGFAAQQRLDELIAEEASLKARHEVLQARLAGNDERLRQSVLHAPFAGTISRRFLDDGAVAAPGTPVLQLIEDAGLEARIGVPVRLASRLKAGQEVTLSSAGHAVRTHILTVGNDVSRSTLSVPIRVAVPPGLGALAGDQAFLELTEELGHHGYWVPLAAVTDGLRGLWSMYVVNADNKIETRDVHILHTDGERAFVRGALAEGDQVVLGGLHRIVPGQHVIARTEQADAETSHAG